MDSAEQDLTDHLIAVRRRWWLVLALTAAGVLAAAVVTALLPRSYQATTSVLVLPTTSQDANAVDGRTNTDINMDTEAQLVQSTAVAGRAGRLLHESASPHALSQAVTVAVPPNSTVLQISYAAGEPAAARAGSHAFAIAYLANRRDATRSADDDATRQLDTQIASVTKRLQQTTSAIGSLPFNSSQRAFEETQRQSLSHQLNDLTNRRNAASTDAASVGRIISDAALPTAAASPLVPVNLGAGALVGLIAGLVVAVAWARLGRRIRYADDLPRHTGVPVLAELPVAPTGLLAAGTGGGRVFSRLRNELSDSAELIVVTGTAGGAALDVALNLAAAFGRAGTETIALLATGTAGQAEVPATPGWSEVVAGDAGLAAALHVPAGEAHLRVVPDGAAQASPESVRPLLGDLRARAGRVVIAAPDTTAGPDAQTLASASDAAILAVELGVTTRAEVADAAEQLRRVGTPLLGAVLLPRYPAPSPEPPAAESIAEPATEPETAAAEPVASASRS
jgi:capsular polysaccharide biosynthesis protein